MNNQTFILSLLAKADRCKSREEAEAILEQVRAIEALEETLKQRAV